jgi:hypothetical protein
MQMCRGHGQRTLRCNLQGHGLEQTPDGLRYLQDLRRLRHGTILILQHLKHYIDVLSLPSYALTVKGSVEVLNSAGYPCLYLILVAHINLLPVYGSAVFRQRFREALHSFTILVR